MKVSALSVKHTAESPYFFKDLTFELTPGKLHALHGKNGVGKSVLLHALSQKLGPGAIMDGAITGINDTTLVNQRYDLMIADQFSFEENLKFARMGKYPSALSRLQSGTSSNELLELFAIDKKKPVYTLSGGQRQILSLMMVLERPLDLLLLDEPTATLDEENAHLVFSFLQKLTERSITMLAVCHDRELISQYCTGSHFELISDSDGSRRLLETPF